jgi:hypothetical protein
MARSYRIVWLLVAVLFALLAGCIAAWISWSPDKSARSAVRAGAMAFAGAFGLLIAAYIFVGTGY